MLTNTFKEYHIATVNLILLFSDTKIKMFYLQTPGLNIITEYVMGLVYPGRPIANVCFKVYGYMSMAQAVSFLSDFKLGHYMKIPPRSMFIVQVDCIVHLTFFIIMLSNCVYSIRIEQLCFSPNQPHR